MKLSKLLSVLPSDLNISIIPSDIEVNQLRVDSREVTEGDLFFAYYGTSIDSRNFILDVVHRGVAVILYDSHGFSLSQEMLSAIKQKNITLIDVPDLIIYIGLIAGQFYFNPSSSMHIYAITGTNGKTTCNYLLAQMVYFLLHCKVGLIGTTGFGEISHVINKQNNLSKLANTTPGAVLLQQLLSEFKSDGCHSVCMEASSHALDQYRLSGVNIKTAIFTNLSHDHLDYHKTLEDYYLAKKKLFLFATVENIIINIDDPYGERLLEELLEDLSIQAKKIIIYGLSQQKLAKYKLPYVSFVNNQVVFYNLSGSVKYDYNSKLIGQFNVYNNLAIIAAMIASNFKLDDILSKLPQLTPAPGRMEVFHCNRKSVDLIVDYAHTPDALEKALKALIGNKINKIWCIFGCGGDRDKDKRPKMGNIAALYSDYVVITDDNPRTESPISIIHDIKNGINPECREKIFAIINNRREAIKLALEHSVPGDKILIAGKGHEDYQIYGTEYLPYNEREYVAQLTK